MFMYSITYYIIQKYLHIHYCCRWWSHISCTLYKTWQCFPCSYCNQSHNFNTLCMLQVTCALVLYIFGDDLKIWLQSLYLFLLRYTNYLLAFDSSTQEEMRDTK